MVKQQQLNYVDVDGEDEEEGDARILYRASFGDTEDGLVGYDTAQWLLLSLVLLLAWGVGLLMLLYIPFRRWAVRQDIRSRRLYVTTNAIVYKSLYDIHSIRIENASRRKPPPGDDLQILGVDNPKMFRKVVLKALSNLRKEKTAVGTTDAKTHFNDVSVDQHTPVLERPSSQGWAWQQGTGLSSWQMSYSPVLEETYESPHILSGDMVMRRLEDIETSIKRIEVLIEQGNVKPVEILHV